MATQVSNKTRAAATTLARFDVVGLRAKGYKTATEKRAGKIC